MEYTDNYILEWIEKRVDDITIRRDVSAGVKVEVSACSSRSGCPIEKQGNSVRQVVSQLIREDSK